MASNSFSDKKSCKVLSLKCGDVSSLQHLIIHPQCRTRCITQYLKVCKFVTYQFTFSFNFVTVYGLFE